ncbi:MAG: hypothetical protein D6698_14765 [Gammaproteobacteria bacterium]|nr:MAG: hypothetical protein D6698_14765 [Gammaproteobacteria bacterium]
MQGLIPAEIRKIFEIFFMMLVVACWSSYSHADTFKYDVMLLSELEGFDRFNIESGRPVKDSQIDFEEDLFATAALNDWHVLFEGLIGAVSGGEVEADVERLIVGRDLAEENRLWLGRYHLPLDAWNLNFHHGTYLKTSIGRPGIIDWEDHGAPVPTHVTGGLLEGAWHLDDPSVLSYHISLGLSPVYRNDHLDPLDLLEPLSQDNRLLAALRIAYKPHEFLADETGLVVAASEIPFNQGTLRESRLNLLGAFVFLEQQGWEWISSLFLVDTASRFRSGGKHDDRFANGYLQAAYQLSNDWKVYGRLEGSVGLRDSLYLEQFREFVQGRQILGIRYEITGGQAIKLQWDNAVRTRSGHFDQLSIEWSGVLK